MAADKTGRICRSVELDPLYVDVIIRRYEAASGETAPRRDQDSFHELSARPERRTDPHWLEGRQKAGCKLRWPSVRIPSAPPGSPRELTSSFRPKVDPGVGARGAQFRNFARQ
jgi:hypothetical protein